MKNASDFFNALGKGSNTTDVVGNTASNIKDVSNAGSNIPNATSFTNPNTTNSNISGDSWSTLPSDSININDGGSSIMNFLNQGGKGNFIDIGKRSFILEIISSWYLLVAIPAMTVTYNVLKTLQDKGILKALYENVSDGLNMLVEVSVTCPQYIDNIERLFQCLSTGQ